MEREIHIIFARRVRHEREKRGLSQEKLAEMAELHRNYIGVIERAEQSATLATVAKIARALSVTPCELLAP